MIEFNNSTHSPQIRDHILRNQFSLYHVCVSCELWYDKHKSWKVYTILMYPYYRSVRLCWCWAGRVDNLEIGSGTEFVKHGPRCWLKEPAPPAYLPLCPARARNTGIWPQAAHYKLSSGSNIFTRQATTPHSFLTKSAIYLIWLNWTRYHLFGDSQNWWMMQKAQNIPPVQLWVGWARDQRCSSCNSQLTHCLDP